MYRPLPVPANYQFPEFGGSVAIVSAEWNGTKYLAAIGDGRIRMYIRSTEYLTEN